MRALIVVESWFGNTRAVAGAVADGLGQFMTVDVSEVGDAPARVAPDVDLVVVGGPTHAFAMSRPNTRRDAAQQAGVRTGTERGIREWLASSPGGIQRGAAFDHPNRQALGARVRRAGDPPATAQARGDPGHRSAVVPRQGNVGSARPWRAGASPPVGRATG